jgi:DNA replication protein DnaC
VGLAVFDWLWDMIEADSERRHLFISGDTGNSKSRASILAVVSACRRLLQRHPALWIYAPDIGTQVEDDLEVADVLLLDDVGRGLQTAARREALHALMMKRFDAGLTMIITSNDSPSEFCARFGSGQTARTSYFGIRQTYRNLNPKAYVQ